MGVHVLRDALRVPVGQRVQLDPAGGVDLEELEIGAVGGLEPLAAGDPGLEGGERPLQRPGLAQVAAGVGVGTVERALRVLGLHLGPVGAHQAHAGQAQLLRQALLIGERGGEQHPGLEEQDRQGLVDLADQVQERRRLRAEGGDERQPARELLVGGGPEHVLRLGAAILGVEAGGHLLGRLGDAVAAAALAPRGPAGLEDRDGAAAQAGLVGQRDAVAGLLPVVVLLTLGHRLGDLDRVEAHGEQHRILVGDHRAGRAQLAPEAEAAQAAGDGEAAPVREGGEGDRHQAQPRQPVAERPRVGVVGHMHAHGAGALREAFLAQAGEGDDHLGALRGHLSVGQAHPQVRRQTVRVTQRHRSPP